MNLHAHSKAWAGVTNGMKQNKEEVFEAYTKLHYDIIGISNYHDPQSIYFKGKPDSLTVYEYGYNLFKAHRLVIGYGNAKFREVSLFHSLHDRQFILNTIYPESKVTIIAHPQFGHGHKMEDFNKLSNYHLIEVLNHYRYSPGEWDLALSSGKPVFIVGNDDMHDLDKPGEVGVRYTMVDGKENLELTLNELKNGNAYAVAAPERNCDLQLSSCLLDGMKIQVEFNDKADKIIFISDRGIVKDSALNTNSSSYILKQNDSYVRIEASKGNCKLYLNPVIRTKEGLQPKNEQEVPINWVATIAEKLALLLAAIMLIWLLINTRIKFYT